MATSHGTRHRGGINVPMSDEDLQRLADAAAQRGESRASLARRLLRQALDALGVER